MSTTNEWGIDDAYLLALGKINVAFQRLEEHLGYTAFLLMGGDRRIAQCVTSECNFDRLVHLISSLFKLRAEQFGELHPDLAEILKAGLNKANQANVERNQVIHSQWGFDRDFNLVIEKIEAKAKRGLRAVQRKAGGLLPKN